MDKNGRKISKGPQSGAGGDLCDGHRPKRRRAGHEGSAAQAPTTGCDATASGHWDISEPVGHKIADRRDSSCPGHVVPVPAGAAASATAMVSPPPPSGGDDDKEVTGACAVGGAGGDSGKSEAYSRETLPEAGSSLGRSGGRDTEGHGAEEAMIMDPHSLAKSGADRREVESCLRKALRDLDPQRRKVRSLDGSRRVPIARASAAELAAAVAALQDCKRKIDSEAAPYRSVERAMRGCSTVAAAVAAGAIDMRAAHNETVVQMTGRGGVPSATLSDRSGFVFFPGFLTAMEQQRWVRRILRRYISTPHRTNRGETSDLWNSYVRSESPELRLQDISWSTLGWHYNWTERAYHEGDASPFPPELDDLSRRVAAACGQSIVPEAAIVNLYAAGSSTMGGHRDDLERTFDAPVVSVSLGCTAVFLLGGPDKSVKPYAILVRAGDAMVMGGSTRLAIHGIARVFPKTAPRWQAETAIDDEAGRDAAPGSSGEEAAFERYVRDARLNINVRQVCRH